MSLTDKLQELANIGYKKEKSDKILNDLHSLVKIDSVILRGYATWTLDQLEPNKLPPQVYHVAIEHPQCSDSNSGTEDLPWKTIQKAAETLRAGDTVIIHKGIYRECVQPFCSGFSDKMITYRAADNEEPMMKDRIAFQLFISLFLGISPVNQKNAVSKFL